MSSIRSKIEAENWLVRRLALEGPGLWTVQQLRELAEKLAQDYRPEGPKWRVKDWTQMPEGISVYVVTRGGVVGIHRVDEDERAAEKADAVVQALNALDAEMGNPSESFVPKFVPEPTR